MTKNMALEMTDEAHLLNTIGINPKNRRPPPSNKLVLRRSIWNFDKSQSDGTLDKINQVIYAELAHHP